MNAPSVLALPVARASVPSNMSKTPPKKTTRPPASQGCKPTRTAPTMVMPKPIRVRPFGVSPSRPKNRATGSPSFLTRVRVSGLTSEPPPVGFVAVMRPARRRSAAVRRAAEAEQGALAGQRLVEGVRAEAAQRLAAAPAGGHDARGAELAEVPADERLGQPDVLDELGDRRRARATGAGRSAAGSRRQGRDGTGAAGAARRAGRRRMRWSSGCGQARGSGDGSRGASSAGWLNTDLYKSLLMLRPGLRGVNPSGGPAKGARFARLHSVDARARRSPAARRARRRGLPGGTGADDHRGRPAVDRWLDLAGLDPAPPGILDRQRLPARVRRRRCRSPGGWRTCGAPGGCSSWALVAFTLGSLLAGAAQTPRRADRGAARPGRRRRRRSSRWPRPPRRTCSTVRRGHARSAPSVR